MFADSADVERLRITSTGATFTGTITATGGTSTEWNTAYDNSINWSSCDWHNNKNINSHTTRWWNFNCHMVR